MVLDIGTSTTRAGYAGDDTPKAIIPTCYGFKKDASSEEDVAMTEAGQEGETAPQPSGKVNMYIGNNGPTIWRDGMEVAHPVRDGLST